MQSRQATLPQRAAILCAFDHGGFFTLPMPCSRSRAWIFCPNSKCVTVVFRSSPVTMSNMWENFTCVVDAHAGASRPNVEPCLCGKSKHTLFVSIICLSITWGPARSSGLQSRRETGRARTKRSTKSRPPPGRASFPHKVRLQWKRCDVGLYGHCLPLHFLQSRGWLRF